MAKNTDSAVAAMLTGLLSSFNNKVIPTGETFAERLAQAAYLLMEEYAQKDTPLTEAMDRLVLAFGNRKDPFIASLGLMQHAGASLMLNQIRAQRETRREQQRKEELVRSDGG